jgi:hypothetical protein
MHTDDSSLFFSPPVGIPKHDTGMIMGMMGVLATRACMQASLSSVQPHPPITRALSQLAAGGEGGNEGHPLQAASTPSAVASATPSAAASAAVHEGSESQDGQPDAKTFAQRRGLNTPAAEPQGASPPGTLSRVEGLGDALGCGGQNVHVIVCIYGCAMQTKRKKKRQGCSHEHRDEVC